MNVFICTNSDEKKCQGQTKITTYDNNKGYISMCSDNYDGCPCRKEAELHEINTSTK